MTNSELIVHALPMVELNGATNVPTVVTYVKSRAAVGQEALAVSREDNLILNEDFKIDLGNYEPTAAKRKRFMTSLCTEKSAAELTADFLGELIARTRSWLSFNGLDVAPSILLAEPLKDPKNPDWIKNYRLNIERILIGKGFDKSRIDFLPEPFAVFQYYRYGFRHPVLADKRVHRALVLDFGGGTFDACVVESKKDGDISLSNRNANPLGASSIPIGGFEVNRFIAELLVIRTHVGLESKVRKGIDLYKKWRRTPEDLLSYSAEYASFVKNFDRLVHDIEVSKLNLSKNIRSWTLNAVQTISVSFHR